MAKGNYASLQYLKPTEIKVGELYNNWVDGFVKNGELERAAKAKMLAEQKKSAQEMVATIDPKVFTTLQSFQPQTNAIFNTILDNKSILGRMADSGKLDSEFYNLKSKTDNLASQYIQLSTIVANPQFLEADKKINEQIQSGDIFEGDENMGRWMSVKSGIARLEANPNTGNIEVIYNDNIKGTDNDKPARVEQLHEFTSNYSSGVSKDLKGEIQDKLKAVSAEASKTINRDGTTTYSSKAFNEASARNTITQLMGLDPNKPVEEQFTNVKNLTPYAKQYFYGNGRLRFPQNGEDLKVLVDDAVNFAKGYSNTAYGSVTSESAQDRELKNWQIKNAKKNFYKSDAPSGGSVPVVSIVKQGTVTRKYNDSKSGESTVDYNNGVIINLKNKEFVAGYKVPNRNGKGYHNEYFIIGNDEKGRQTIESVAKTADVFSKFNGYGIDPLAIDRSVSASEPIKMQNIKKGNNVGVIKYDQSYRPATETVE